MSEFSDAPSDVGLCEFSSRAGSLPTILMTEESKQHNPLLLEMRQIDKSFPGVHALENVSMKLRRSEVLGLVGENGAGKSTLIKVLGGAHLPDSGRIFVEGRPVSILSPTAAQQAGVSTLIMKKLGGFSTSCWKCFSCRKTTGAYTESTSTGPELI